VYKEVCEEDEEEELHQVYCQVVVQEKMLGSDGMQASDIRKLENGENIIDI